MKIALIGYGKMGKAIEQILLDRNHEVVARFNAGNFDKELLKKADVAIEFTRAEAVFGNLAACFDAGIPVVSGTTGWLAQYDEAVTLCRSKNSGFLYASNFSLGVNIFFEINKKLASIMNNYDGYDVSLEEIHHTQKLDAPSGTAITLAEQIVEKISRKKGWTMDDDQPGQVKVTAKRIDNVAGTHTVHYDSEIDSIEIKHTAHSRQGFALGAVLAAEFMVGKTGIYTMQDVLKL